jgi:hypothetical protein
MNKTKLDKTRAIADAEAAFKIELDEGLVFVL